MTLNSIKLFKLPMIGLFHNIATPPPASTEAIVCLKGFKVWLQGVF